MSFLARHFLSYAPIVNQQRVAIASRVTVRPAEGAMGQLSEAYEAFSSQWSPDGGALLLDLGGVDPDGRMLSLAPREDLWIEVPSELVNEGSGREFVGMLRSNGFKLVMRGRPVGELPPDLLDAFQMSLIPISQDRRINQTASERAKHSNRRSIGYALTEVASIDEMERGFDTGAAAIVGWPFEDAMERADKPSSNPSFATVAKLLQMTSAGAEPAAMEKEVRRDPVLAFRLFRYLNSPAFGLRVEIQSFQHALMMLGYKRLKKWLALLIATAAQDANLQPVMFASLRRGFFLEGLTREHADPNTRDEAFILGVFSLLDKLFSESFDRLFTQLQIPPSVHEALVEGTGPFMPYLKVAQAMELPAGPGIQDALDNALISLRDCNHTLIKALIESGQTQQPA